MSPLAITINIHKALGDATRLRALALLAHRELCLCQLLDIFQLSPSTLSKHMAVLQQAGLVEQRKAGRWRYFRRLEHPTPEIQSAYAWLDAVVAHDPEHAGDLCALKRVLQTDLETLCCRYDR